jgi:hypothetical protein
LCDHSQGVQQFNVNVNKNETLNFLASEKMNKKFNFEERFEKTKKKSDGNEPRLSLVFFWLEKKGKQLL